MTSFTEVLREVHQRFAAAPLSFGHGTDNAWDEAVALVLGMTGLPDAQSSLDMVLREDQAAAIRNLAERRVGERAPLAYLLGKTPYCGEMFRVPEGIVVPRSPIGPLLMAGLQPWVEAPPRILDLCCGSGCLGILAAKRFPNARVVLADIDPLAVATARRNIAAHGLEGRVEALRSDLFAGLLDGLPGKVGVPNDRKAGIPEDASPEKVVVPEAEGRTVGVTKDGKVGVPNSGGTAGVAKEHTGVSSREFDLILCNPPYVDADAMAALPPEFACEPALGLDGGSDGLALINRVIGEVSGFLAEQGVLVGEVGEAAGRLEARWPGQPFCWPDLPAGGAGVFLLHAADAP